MCRSVGRVTAVHHGSTPFRHECNETGEVVIGIMGARTGFWVVLHSKDGLVTMGHRRHRSVVEIEVSDHNLLAV